MFWGGKVRERKKEEEEVEKKKTMAKKKHSNAPSKLTSINPPSPSSTGTRGGDRGGMIATTPSPSYSFFFFPPNKPMVCVSFFSCFVFVDRFFVERFLQLVKKKKKRKGKNVFLLTRKKKIKTLL